MVQEILEFSRGTSTTILSDTSLPAAMEQVLPFLETDLAARKITLVRAYGYDGVALLDAGKFARVLTNLVSNAADVMPEGGTVTIRTSRSDDRVAIEVSDTGPGIPEEIRQRLFEPFFTHGKKHGTGLGLSIVKKIIEDHRGTIEVLTTPGQGSTFRLLLPPPSSAGS
jgi:signal transduction histidine kinase